jgi:hypothetical protein
MESTVDMDRDGLQKAFARVQQSRTPTSVHLHKAQFASTGLDVARLISGHYAIGIHQSNGATVVQSLVLELTAADLRSFIDSVQTLLGEGTSRPAPPSPPPADERPDR